MERMSAWSCEGPWVWHQSHPLQGTGYNVLLCSRRWPPVRQKESQCSEQAHQGQWDLGRALTLPYGRLWVCAQLFNVMLIVTPVALVLAGLPVIFAMQTAVRVSGAISHLASTC